MPSTVPLSIPVLLSRVLGHLTRNLEKEAETGPTVPSLAVWSNVVRGVADAGPDGLAQGDLPGVARISKRLATAAVTGASRRTWITVEPGPGGAKDLRLRLAPLGEAATGVWPPLLAGLDREWAGTPLRDALEGIVAGCPLELPHFPATYGTADPSATGGAFVQSSKRVDGIPAHGQDWRPVLRSGADASSGPAVSSLPITALLSQALMAFTVDYEDRFPWPLASTANVLVHVGAEPRPLAAVPGDHGITGNGKSLLERHLIVSVTADPAAPRKKLVALTDRGKAVMAHHPGRLEEVEREWRERYGDAAVTALRDALAPLAAAAPADLPDHVLAPLHLG